MAGGFNSYSTTPASNTSINGISIAEGCPPSGINDALRQIAADGRDLYDKSAVWGGTAGGSANAQTLALAVAALVTGQSYRFIAAASNTAAATLNINSLGATAIKRLDASALQAGDLVSGQLATVCYTGTNFILLKDTATQFRGAMVPSAGSVYGTGVATAIVWTTATYDTSSFFAGGAPARLTIPTGVSVARFHVGVSYTAPASGTGLLQFQKNGGGSVAGCSTTQCAVTGAVGVNMAMSSPPLQVAAADYFQVFFTPGHGSNVTLANTTATYFAAEVIQ